MQRDGQRQSDTQRDAERPAENSATRAGLESAHHSIARFWTEVPEEELVEMVVRQSEKELVAFFQLHLPYIRVDIESWQVSGELLITVD